MAKPPEALGGVGVGGGDMYLTTRISVMNLQDYDRKKKCKCYFGRALQRPASQDKASAGSSATETQTPPVHGHPRT